MLAIVGVVAVSRVVAERDSADQQRRAEREQQRAESERQRAETALAESQEQRERMALDAARLEAERNPAAVRDWLASYRGGDVDVAQELAAIATARGAATFTRNRGGPLDRHRSRARLRPAARHHHRR